jgi:hypothetical protein
VLGTLSEWLQLMLAEIARKGEEEERAHAEARAREHEAAAAAPAQPEKSPENLTIR